MTFRDQIITGRRGTVLIAHSGGGADGRERAGSRVTRRSVIGGVVGAGLLEVLAFGSPFQGRAMADTGQGASPGAGQGTALDPGPDAGVGANLGTGTDTGLGADSGLGAGAGADTGLGADLAEAPFTANRPRVYTRAQWRARPPKHAAKVLDRAPDHIVVHHTATGNSNDFSVEHAFSLSRYIQNFHMDKNHWDDCGQHLTISRGGVVMEGRNKTLASIRSGDLVVGAQVLHHNEHTLGIENEGNYMKKAPPGRLWASLTEVCVWLCREYDLDPAEAIVGHRDYNKTSCPGDVLYSRLPALRRAVADRLDGSSGSSSKPKSKPKGKPKEPSSPKPGPKPQHSTHGPGGYYDDHDDDDGGWHGLLNLNW